MDQHNDKVSALLKEAEALFPDSLIQQIKRQFTLDPYGVITKIDNLKKAVGKIVEALQTQQSQAAINEYCNAAIQAKASLCGLLYKHECTAIYAEVKKEASIAEDITEELRGTQL